MDLNKMQAQKVDNIKTENKKIKKYIVIGVILVMGISLGISGLFSGRKIDEVKSFDIEGVKEIKLRLTSEPVNIVQSTAGSPFRVRLYGNAMQEIKLSSELEKGVLDIKVKRMREGCIPENMHVEVYIPEDYIETFSLHTSSGPIKMDSMEFAAFNLDTSSGKLIGETLTARKVQIRSSSASINLKKVEAEDLKIEGSSSPINIDDCNAKAAHIVTTSGSVNIALPANAEFFLDSKTTSGRIQSDFQIGNSKDKRKLAGRIGTKDNQLIIQTSSGNIKITKQ